MLTTALGIVFKLVQVIPQVVSDVESDVSKIKSDTKLSAKITDGFKAFDQLLTDILAAL